MTDSQLTSLIPAPYSATIERAQGLRYLQIGKTMPSGSFRYCLLDVTFNDPTPQQIIQSIQLLEETYSP